MQELPMPGVFGRAAKTKANSDFLGASMEQRWAITSRSRPGALVGYWFVVVGVVGVATIASAADHPAKGALGSALAQCRPLSISSSKRRGKRRESDQQSLL